MKVLNPNNIPTPLFKLLSQDDHDITGSDVSITSLLQPGQIQMLTRQHWKDLTINCEENLCVTLGKLLHKALAEVEGNAITEERFFKTFDLGDLGSVTVSGAIDYYDPFAEGGPILCDYKLVTANGLKSGIRDEWIAQTNCYKYLIEQAGMPTPTKLQIVAVIKDWSKNQAQANPEYFQSPIQILDIPIWADTEEFLIARLKAFQRTKLHGICECCSPEDTWQQPDVFKVQKIGATRSTKNFATREEAMLYLEGNANADKYEIRCCKGEPIRCKHFCRVSQFCPQYQQYLQDQASK